MNLTGDQGLSCIAFSSLDNFPAVARHASSFFKFAPPQAARGSRGQTGKRKSPDW
jgi:hypothetical protein